MCFEEKTTHKHRKESRKLGTNEFTDLFALKKPDDILPKSLQTWALHKHSSG